MKILIRMAVMFSFGTMWILAWSQDKTKISFNADEVAPGLYMLSGVGGFAGGNIGLSIGEDGVVMIDDSMPSMLDILQQAIKDVTDKPVDFLINTHVHGDHIGNNEIFSSGGARIVAHQKFRQRLLDEGFQTRSGMVEVSDGVLPVITFFDSMNFYLNGEDALLFHTPDAHTDGDTVVYFKTSNVIHTGDTYFHGLFPFIDLDSGGSLNGYIAAQKKILGLSNVKTKIIPGHGPLASKADLERDLAMLEDAKKIILKLVKKGKSEKKVVKMNPLKKYHDDWSWGFITTEKMTRQLYKSVKAGK